MKRNLKFQIPTSEQVSNLMIQEDCLWRPNRLVEM